MLCDKYAPTTLNGIIGNSGAVGRLNKFAGEVHGGKAAKPLLLYGPSGTGKTAAVHALAYMNGFELFELNASDYRDGEKLRRTVIPAAGSRGLFGKTILILLDEIDELSTRLDSGAQSVIRELVSKSRQPVIFTAEDYWDQKISFLRNSVEKLEFHKPSAAEISRLLTSIAKKEGIEIDDGIIAELAKRSGGDVRGAVNDLELMLGAKEELMENIATREKKQEVFYVLDKVFLSRNFELARNAVMQSDVDIEMLMNWIDENIPNRFIEKHEINDAYDSTARASRFLAKASRSNYWGYLRYASIMLSSGIAASNNGYVTRLKQYSFPYRIRFMGATKDERSMLNGIAERLSRELHTNKRMIIREYVPMLKARLSASASERGEEDAVALFCSTFGLEEDEAKFLLHAIK